jgi:hypothetical protein
MDNININDCNSLYHLNENQEFPSFFAKSSKEDKETMIATIISNLEGTCMSTTEDILEEYGLTDEFLRENGFDEIDVAIIIDSVIMECPICGWWVETGVKDNCFNDYDEEDLCEDCGCPFEYCQC